MNGPFLQCIVYADVPFLDYYSECEKEKERLFSFTETYIQFLHLITEYRGQVHIKLALPPVYFTLLDQPEFKSQMWQFLLESKNDQRYLWVEWSGDLNSVLSTLIHEGKLELLGLPATGVLLPFLTTSEGIETQIQTGRAILSDLFGEMPDGFWFPKGAYTPGIDVALKNSSYQYSYIDESSVMSADPPPSMKGLPVQSPHGLIFFPIHENLSGILTENDGGKNSFITALKNVVRERSEEDIQTTITIVSDLQLYTERNDVLKAVSYFADEGFLSINSKKYTFLDSIDTVHLCASFLSNEIGETQLINNEELLTKHLWMEKELQALAKISKEMEETRVYKQMIREWMMLSTSLLSHYQGMQQYAKSYIEYFQKMYSYLLGEGNDEIVTKRETELAVLTTLKFPTAEEEIVDTIGKRRILVLTWEFPPHIVGGLARHVHGLTKSLSKMGYEIHVITAHQEELPVYERLDGVFVHRVKPLNENEKDFLMWIGGLNIAISEQAEVLAREYQFDCIHAHDWLVGASASVLKDRLAIPLVTTIHATEFGRNNGIYTEMQNFIHEKERKLVAQSDQIIVCSDYMKQEVQQLFNPSMEKVSTIPNGIDSEPEIAVRQEDLLIDIPIDPSRKMIFSIGRIVKEKGFDTLIEAATILKEKGSNVYFLIAGKGPMLAEYRRKVDELQLKDTVFFIGFIDDNKRNALFELCDIAVFPSLYEPFGIVALESMKANKPTIVSNTGGLKGIVQHLKTGLLMIPGSTDSLIEQIIRLLNDPSLAKHIGENGKKIVESLFSWNRVAEETKRVFEEVKMNGKL